MRWATKMEEVTERIAQATIISGTSVSLECSCIQAISSLVGTFGPGIWISSEKSVKPPWGVGEVRFIGNETCNANGEKMCTDSGCGSMTRHIRKHGGKKWSQGDLGLGYCQSREEQLRRYKLQSWAGENAIWGRKPTTKLLEFTIRVMHDHHKYFPLGSLDRLYVGMRYPVHKLGW